MIVIVNDAHDISPRAAGLIQILMYGWFLLSLLMLVIYFSSIYRILPILWSLYCIGLVAETASMITAMAELNLVVVRKSFLVTLHFLFVCFFRRCLTSDGSN
jgi:hypothetical protein